MATPWLMEASIHLQGFTANHHHPFFPEEVDAHCTKSSPGLLFHIQWTQRTVRCKVEVWEEEGEDMQPSLFTVNKKGVHKRECKRAQPSSFPTNWVRRVLGHISPPCYFSAQCHSVDVIIQAGGGRCKLFRLQFLLTGAHSRSTPDQAHVRFLLFGFSGLWVICTWRAEKWGKYKSGHWALLPSKLKFQTCISPLSLNTWIDCTEEHFVWRVARFWPMPLCMFVSWLLNMNGPLQAYVISPIAQFLNWFSTIIWTVSIKTVFGELRYISHFALLS